MYGEGPKRVPLFFLVRIVPFFWLFCIVPPSLVVVSCCMPFFVSHCLFLQSLLFIGGLLLWGGVPTTLPSQHGGQFRAQVLALRRKGIREQDVSILVPEPSGFRV